MRTKNVPPVLTARVFDVVSVTTGEVFAEGLETEAVAKAWIAKYELHYVNMEMAPDTDPVEAANTFYVSDETCRCSHTRNNKHGSYLVTCVDLTENVMLTRSFQFEDEADDEYQDYIKDAVDYKKDVLISMCYLVSGSTGWVTTKRAGRYGVVKAGK